MLRLKKVMERSFFESSSPRNSIERMNVKTSKEPI
jgi:hypothetical protein